MDALPELVNTAQAAIAGAADLAALDQARVHYLGKKGALTERLKELGRLPPEQRREAGQAINEAKQALETALAARKNPGAPSPANVAAQLKRWRKLLSA